MVTMIDYQQERIARVNGIDINYDTFGNANNPPVLLIMGLATQMIFWHRHFCEQLAARGFYVIRFDNRDIGKSSHLHHLPVPNLLSAVGQSLFGRTFEVPYMLEDMADDALQLLKHLNIDKAHIVGASMGGMIAQLMAIKSPSSLHSLTSIMSTTGDRSLAKPKKQVMLQFIQPMPRDPEGYIKRVISMWKLLHGTHYDFEEPQMRDLISQAYHRGYYPSGVVRQLSAILAAPDRTAKLRQLNVPSLVLHGEDDVLVPLPCGIATAEAIPNAKLVTYPGMGHTFPTQLWAPIIYEIDALAKMGT